VISARALGIPARYIYNEAHAFVEVYWPKMGWRRIDLGGAAEQLNYNGRRGGGVHQAAPDALPQPPNYISELERMGADIPGYQQDETGEASEDMASSGGAEEEPSGAGGEAAPGESSASNVDEPGGEESEVVAGEDEALQAAAERAVENAEVAPAADAPVTEPEVAQAEVAQAEVDPRVAVRIDAVASNPEIFRGTALQLNGSIFSVQGRPISRAMLKVYLGPLGAESTDGLVLLGEVESNSSGRFSGQFPIPDDISIGRWSVILRFEGNDNYQPAQVD